MLSRQFASVGGAPGGAPLVAATMDTFHCWSSGRRGIGGMVATFRLRKRQDLLSSSLGMFTPRRDTLDVKVRGRGRAWGAA